MWPLILVSTCLPTSPGFHPFWLSRNYNGYCRFSGFWSSECHFELVGVQQCPERTIKRLAMPLKYAPKHACVLVLVGHTLLLSARFLPVEMQAHALNRKKIQKNNIIVRWSRDGIMRNKGNRDSKVCDVFLYLSHNGFQWKDVGCMT